MKIQDFHTRTFGKWILAGEHAVLRGSPALVFPLTSRFFDLHFKSDVASNSKLKVEFVGNHGSELELPFWSSLEKACELFDVDRSELKGKLSLSSSIPVGAGLGASAALCVGLARWFTEITGSDAKKIPDQARLLENLFHGESSGVDVAVVSSERPLRYVRGGDLSVLETAWQPMFYVSYSGKRGVTRECVSRVQELLKKNPDLAGKIDEDMKAAVQEASSALSVNTSDSVKKLTHAIEKAEKCFHSWGLCDGRVRDHLQWLKSQGAIAVKPTGSGDGGYCLSLWTTPPSNEAMSQLIPCFS